MRKNIMQGSASNSKSLQSSSRRERNDQRSNEVAYLFYNYRRPRPYKAYCPYPIASKHQGKQREFDAKDEQKSVSKNELRSSQDIQPRSRCKKNFGV